MYKETERHVLFWGSIFSNFAKAPFKVDDKYFYTSEQYFMYMKAITFNDNDTAELILKAKEPKLAKKLGRQVKNYNDKLWGDIRYNIMYDAIKYKFDNNPNLKKELMSHKGKTFVEASPFDKIWGIGISSDNPDSDDESKWKGTNLLGKALTQLRDYYEK